MQTFLPVPDFQETARILDWRRLGKQRVEAIQILLSIERTTRWSNHPAVKMWVGYEAALSAYANAIIAEWVARGYRNNMGMVEHGPIFLPSWLGDDAFHASHRSNLLRKDQEYYGQFGWKEGPDLPYFWPSK